MIHIAMHEISGPSATEGRHTSSQSRKVLLQRKDAFLQLLLPRHGNAGRPACNGNSYLAFMLLSRLCAARADKAANTHCRISFFELSMYFCSGNLPLCSTKIPGRDDTITHVKSCMVRPIPISSHRVCTT